MFASGSAAQARSAESSLHGVARPRRGRPGRVWTPLALDLGAATPAGFQAAASLEIGVRFLSGVASEGDTVFEIDTVTD
jgi:hypothetical protein